MKFRRIVAFALTIAMLGSVCNALPLSASASSRELVNDTSFNISGKDYSYYSTDDGYTIYEYGSWLKVKQNTSGNVAVGDNAFIIDLGDEVAEGDQLSISFTASNGNGTTASGLNVYVEDTKIGSVEPFAGTSGVTQKTFSETVMAPKPDEGGTQVYLEVTSGPAKVWLKNVIISITPANKPETSDVNFTIASPNGAAAIYIDPESSEYDGLSLIADTFAGDVELVSGQKPEVRTASDVNDIKGSIIAGTVDDELIKSTGIDTSDIKGKNEVYKIQVVGDNLVIAGSDKRGTIYGIFHISEKHMGVSPWVYWADIIPEMKDTVGFTACVDGEISKEPSVTYRGIFLNDEAPNLTSWSDKAFGAHFGPEFYGKVFELILRLKGNYLWPAMWSNEFYKEGERGGANLATFKKAMGLTQGALANAELADKYGVFMGTSHHEPMGRAGNEWAQERNNYLSKYYPDAVGKSSGATWNYFMYPKAIDAFWKDGYKRSKDYENVVTIGMRGEADSPLSGTIDDNIQNLENVITSQFNIMDEVSGEGNRPPTILALYKEVEDFWVGKAGNQTATVTPLKDWGVADGTKPLQDTIILLANDNFGNVRTFPTAEESASDAYGGWGMYYHFDYNGGPRSYRWVSSVQLEKIWQNMTDCYEYGVDDMWIVNVGDLKPHELEISYFLDLAYDYDKWKDENQIEEYTKQWTAQQFKQGNVSNETIEEIAQLQSDYLKLNATRRAEIVFPVTYSLTESNELYSIIARAQDIYSRAHALENDIPDNLKDAYYQLVQYPAAGSANVTLMNAYSALSNRFSSSGSLLANKYAVLVNECIQIDTDMQKKYNTGISQGKWNGMMSNRNLGHINCTDWNLSTWSYPGAYYVKPATEATLILHAEGTKNGAKNGGVLTLPVFTSTNKEAYAITVSNGGKNKLDYTATASVDWITLSKTSGSVYSGEVITVTIDWSKLSTTDNGTITVTSGEQSVTVNVTAEVIDTAGISEGTFVGKNGMISIEAEHYSFQEGMMTVDNLGKNLSTIRTKTYTETYAPNDSNAPYAAYNVYVPTDGIYTITTIAGPSNPRTTSDILSYAIKVGDDGSAVSTNSIPDNFIAGNNSNAPWSNGVTQNAHISSQNISLKAGENIIYFYPSNSAVVLQKLVIKEGADNPYVQRHGVQDRGNEFIGPVESYRIGNESTQQELVHPAVDDIMNIPGVILDNGTVIVSEDGTYKVSATETTGDIELILDGKTVELAKNTDGTYETELAVGEHKLEFTGATSLEFEVLNLVPGIAIDHPMSTQDEVNSVAAGYVNLSNNASVPRDVTFSNSAMMYKNNGTYNSSGFKYDITSIIKRIVEQYGDVEFTLSMDIKAAKGIGTPKMGFRNASGEIASTGLADIVGGDFETVTCKTKLSCQDEVYFFVYTGQPTTYVKNIKITYPAPQKKDLFTHTNSGDWMNYEVCDEANTAAVISNNGGSISITYNTSSGWDSKNGVKIDVTDYIKECDEGALFGATVDFTCYYWADRSWPVSASLEDENGNSVVLCSGLPEEGNDIVVTGEDRFTYSGSGKVYLCIKQMSDNHVVREVSFWGYKTEATEPSKQKTILFQHNFNANKSSEVALYKKYDVTDGATVQGGNGPVLKYTGGTAESKGVKINITDMLTDGMNGLTFGASVKIKPGEGSFRGSADLFFEVIDGNGKSTKIPLGTATSGTTATAEGFDSETGASLGNYWLTTPLNDEATLTYGKGDTVYLCITAAGATQYYDDICVYYYATDEPEGVAVTLLFDKNGKAYITATNITTDDKNINIYCAKYNDIMLQSVQKTVAVVEAGAEDKKIEFPSDEGDAIYVWDDDMNPLLGNVI